MRTWGVFRGVGAFLVALAALLAFSAAASHPVDRWTATPILNPGGSSRLLGVSCPTSTFCAVAGTTYFGPDGHTYLPVIEMRRGDRWSVAVTPRVKRAQTALAAVSCPSASFCVAVGHRVRDGVTSPLAEIWNGRRWTVSAPPPATRGASLDGVACPSPKFCLAVGDTPKPSFVETWNGSAWKVVPTPAALEAVNPGLAGVSCPTPTFCAVAGGDAGGYAGVAFWHDRVWTMPPVVDPADVGFASVSCTSSRFCIASGADETNDTVAERWNGAAWAMLRPHSIGATFGDRLSALSCRSATFCMAAGSFGSDDFNDGMVQRWNGLNWSFSLQFQGPSGETGLAGVSCSSETFCITVGNYGRATVAKLYSAGRS